MGGYYAYDEIVVWMVGMWHIMYVDGGDTTLWLQLTESEAFVRNRNTKY